ncbi:helix-turn-helix domain-containing protein [Micromonospora sp. SL4-19]|uniref:helix-turn-helix domain-containing protein n=1 Tax=Micromonospora sp. SL4-19 TaxID=3399129 RepID=UPI003A4D7410
MPVETALLRTFTAVARTGSFTATARELGYVQSTVTGHVQTVTFQCALVSARLVVLPCGGTVPV